MNKIIIILLTFSLCSLQLSAQLMDFPTGCWQQRGVIKHTDNPGVNPDTYDGIITTYLYDTVSCGLTYKKCLLERYFNGYPLPNDFRYFRNEQGKLYICAKLTCPDASGLIQDFSLMPGDVFDFPGDPADRVDSVNYKSIGNHLRKVIYFQNYTIIDGIGDRENGLYPGIIDDIYDIQNYFMVCQHDSAGFDYKNPDVVAPFSNDPTGHLHICSEITSTNPCSPIARLCKAYFNVEPDTIPHSYIINYLAYGTKPFTYSWTWGDGTTDTGASVTHQYQQGGVYTICLTTIDSTGCTDTYCSSPSLYRLDSSGYMINVRVSNSSVNSNTSVAMLKTNSSPCINVYPNPAANTINAIMQNNQGRSDITIYNALGKKQTKLTTTNNRLSFNLANWPNGIYIFQVVTGNTVIRQQFFKQ